MHTNTNAGATRRCTPCRGQGREPWFAPQRQCRHCAGTGRHTVAHPHRLEPGQGSGKIIAVRTTHTDAQGALVQLEHEVWYDGELLDPVQSMEVRWHSDGFEWGYGGSGPMQLALAIALRLNPDADSAEAIAGEISERFIKGADRDHMILEIADVQAFIEAKRTAPGNARRRETAQEWLDERLRTGLSVDDQARAEALGLLCVVCDGVALRNAQPWKGPGEPSAKSAEYCLNDLMSKLADARRILVDTMGIDTIRAHMRAVNQIPGDAISTPRRLELQSIAIPIGRMSATNQASVAHAWAGRGMAKRITRGSIFHVKLQHFLTRTRPAPQLRQTLGDDAAPAKPRHMRRRAAMTPGMGI